MKTTPVFLWNIYPEKYANVTTDKKVICVNQGGTSSSKTYSILQVLFKLAIENERFVITVVGQDIPNLKRGAIRDAETIVHSDFAIQSMVTKYNGSDKIYYFKNGSILEFTSYESSQDAKNGKRDVLFINEANGIDYSIFYELDMRTKFRTFIDYNPNAEFWVHEKVLKMSNVAFFISNYKHNPFISQSIVDSIESLQTLDPQLWRVYGLGQTGKIEGLVFDYRIVNQMPRYLDKQAFGLDFGFSNDPTTLIHCGLSDGQIYGQEIIYNKGLTNSDINNLLRSNNISKNSVIFADSADPKSIQELKLYGWNIRPADKGNDSINYSISLLKQYGAINITQNSVNWIKEAKAYKWKEERNGNRTNSPVDAFNHAWDACRYWALGMLSANKGKGLMAFTN